MDNTYDILQAIGLGLAFGLRPVLAPFVVALCAWIGVGIDLNHTVVDFLGTPPFVAAFVVFAIIWLVLDATQGRIHQLAHLFFAVFFAALFGAGGYDQYASSWWPGAVAGGLAAALAWAALTPVLAGARTRLAGEREASIILPAAAETAAVITAFLSLIFPPLAIIALIFVLVLLVRGRRNRDATYAGLRTLSK